MNRFQLWGNRVWWCFLGVLYGFFVYSVIFPTDGRPTSLTEFLLLSSVVPAAFLIPFFVFRFWKNPRWYAWIGSFGSVFLSCWTGSHIGGILLADIPEPSWPLNFLCLLVVWLAVQTSWVLIFQNLGIFIRQTLHRTERGEAASSALETPRSSFLAECAGWGLTACACLFFLGANLRMMGSADGKLSEMVTLGLLLALLVPIPYAVFRYWGASRKVSLRRTLCAFLLAAFVVFSIPESFPSFAYALNRDSGWSSCAFRLFLGTFVLMYAVQLVYCIRISCIISRTGT